MQAYKFIFWGVLFVSCWSCIQNAETVKKQKKRNHIIQVRDKVKEIEIENVVISNFAATYIINQYLIISDTKSPDKVIHLFDKNNFNYITSTGDKGLGPFEITRLIQMGINETERIFYASDHGKQQIYRFELDSVLVNPHYLPKIHVKMDKEIWPQNYLAVNDTLFTGTFTLPVKNGDYRPAIGKWNMLTGEIEIMNKYDHPKIERKRAHFAMSLDHGIFVECYNHHDLMTICDLNGELKFYIYGRKWDNATQNRINFYRQVEVCKDKIIAVYADGEDNFVTDKDGKIIPANYPSQFIIFDIHGDYMLTLETGYQIVRFCYDKDSNRIIMAMDDVIQFAYLDMDGII